MLADIPAVILCGGLGTRLRSVVSDRPKALAPIGDEPFLAVQLRLLRQRGIRRFVLCVGHMADQLQTGFGDGSALGTTIQYVRDGERLLGTAGALKRAENFFAPKAFVVNGDTYLDVDLTELLNVHETSGALATMTLAKVADASRYGAIETDGRWVTAFREKVPTSTHGAWINAGVYVIQRELLEVIPRDVPMSLERDVFPHAIQAGGRIAAYPQDGFPQDIGTPESLQAFIQTFLKHQRRAS